MIAVVLTLRAHKCHNTQCLVTSIISIVLDSIVNQFYKMFIYVLQKLEGFIQVIYLTQHLMVPLQCAVESICMRILPHDLVLMTVKERPHVFVLHT